ncbi:MAG: N-acetyltransferase [Bacteroidales bacterium]|jgi:ribosomal protein S18 acetylase RimI-like enzyme
MIFRELMEKDTDAFLKLKQIGLKANPESFVASINEDSPDYAIKVKERIKKASIENGDIILGAFDPDLIGIISITRDKRLKRFHKADLHGMFVKHEYRGNGIGKTLFEKALTMVKNMKGLEEIQLSVDSENKSACALYQKFGFTIAWKEKHATKLDSGYVDAYHMIKNLLDN